MVSLHLRKPCPAQCFCGLNLLVLTTKNALLPASCEYFQDASGQGIQMLPSQRAHRAAGEGRSAETGMFSQPVLMSTQCWPSWSCAGWSVAATSCSCWDAWPCPPVLQLIPEVWHKVSRGAVAQQPPPSADKGHCRRDAVKCSELLEIHPWDNFHLWLISVSQSPFVEVAFNLCILLSYLLHQN